MLWGEYRQQRASGSLLSLACCLRNYELNSACRISTSNRGQSNFQTSAHLHYNKCQLPDLLVWCQCENLQSWLSESSGWQSEQTEWAGSERDCKTINTELSVQILARSLSLEKIKKTQQLLNLSTMVLSGDRISCEKYPVLLSIWSTTRCVKRAVARVWEMQSATGSMKAEEIFNNQKYIGMFSPVSEGPSIKSQCSWFHLLF